MAPEPCRDSHTHRGNRKGAGSTGRRQPWGVGREPGMCSDRRETLGSVQVELCPLTLPRPWPERLGEGGASPGGPHCLPPPHSPAHPSRKGLLPSPWMLLPNLFLFSPFTVLSAQPSPPLPSSAWGEGTVPSARSPSHCAPALAFTPVLDKYQLSIQGPGHHFFAAMLSCPPSHPRQNCSLPRGAQGPLPRPVPQLHSLPVASLHRCT